MKRILCMMIIAGTVLPALAQQKAGPPKEIIVTEVKVTPSGEGVSTASLLLNDVIRVNGIKLTKPSGKCVIKYPVYKSRGGKEYEQVKFLTPQSEKAARDAILSQKPSPMGRKAISYKITGWHKLKGSSSRKVNAELTFNECVAVSCGVMEGRRGSWIAWPAERGAGGKGWLKQVYIENKKVREKVETALIEKYEQELVEENRGR